MMLDQPAHDLDAVPAVVREFLDTQHGVFLDGKWHDPLGSGEIAVFNPSTARQVATVAAASEADVDRAVVAATAALDGAWSKTRPADRSRLLHRLADLIQEHAEEFAVLEALDVGKPVNAACTGDVPGAVGVLRYFAGWTDKIEGDTLQLSLQVPGDFHAFTMREPVGSAPASCRGTTRSSPRYGRSHQPLPPAAR